MSKLEVKKTRAFRSLAVTLATAFSALVIVALIIASSLQMYFSFQAQQKDIVNQQRLIAQDAANTVESFIQEKFNILEAAASLGNLVAVSQEEQKPVLEKLLGLEPAFRQLVLLNAQEEELLRVSRLSKLLSVQLMEYNKSELFPKVSQKETHISSIYIDKITSEPMVIMTVPVTDVFGDFKGILMAEVNLKFMWDLVDSIKIGNKGLAYVVDKQGNLIASGDISRVLRGENLAYLNEVNEFVKGDILIHKESAEVVKGIQGNQVVANHAHLGAPDWAVVVELPVLEAYETVITTLIVSGLIILLSFTLAIIFGIFLSRRIAKPIIDLRDAAKKISKGDLGTRIKVESKNEIGELAVSFNQMVEDLQKTTVSIRVLQKEQKRFQDVVTNTGDWIWEVDAQGRYTYSSPVVEEILGYKPEEVIGKCFYDFFLPGEREELKKAAFEVFAQKAAFKNFLNRNIRKDGQVVIIETSGVPVIGVGGRLLGYRGADRSITERKKAEEEIRKFKTISDKASYGTAISDIEGNLLYVNKAFAMMHGCTIEELIGKNLSVLHSQEQMERVNRLNESLKKEGSFTAEEVWHKRKDGSVFPTLMNATVIKNEKGEALFLSATAIDITEHKKAEQRQDQLLERLEKTNQELKDFAHIVSHDLKAPLRGINTLANWISTDYADKLDDDGKEQMNLLMSRVDQMHNLIEGVLQYSRVGRIKEEKVVMNLNELVTEVIDMIAPPENISIIVENELPTIECEQTRIIQVFENLLSNAVKYMDKPQGQIKVGCIKENGFWKFSVADNGPGIEEKHFERIFKIFQTLSPRDEAESTGVGLTVVKKIIEMYEGSIWVESEVGEGSTFFFTLPKTLSAPVVVVT